MPAEDGPDGKDVDAAAARYAAELAGAAPHGVGVPAFDVMLLGMGPEGHVGSIFPESPAAHDERPVVGVHGCPKPPPTRITLGFSAMTQAREVWLLVTGAEKASAVAMALSGAGRVALPAAGAVGRQQTLWLLDEAAAGQLPPSLRRL
jgi:6-phosphogluconolactonase